MFLDGDAFPIADPMPTDRGGARAGAAGRGAPGGEPRRTPAAPLLLRDDRRHLAQRFPATGRRGPPGRAPRAGRRTDVGGALMRRLELTGTPWVAAAAHQPRTTSTRSSSASTATSSTTTARASARAGPAGSTRPREARRRSVSRCRALAAAGADRAINRRRWRAWEERTQERRLELSQSIYDRIKAGDETWLSELI